MTDELTRTTVRTALADLNDAQHTIADPNADESARTAAERDLPKLLRAAHAALEAAQDPDPPEPDTVDLLADSANVTKALDAPDPVQYLADLAIRSDAPVAVPEALSRVLRHGHRDEPAPADLVAAAEQELTRRERAARRAERLALLAADDASARDSLRDARAALESVRAMRPIVSAAQHAAARTDWTGIPPDRKWLLQDWLAVGRVHLLTGRGGRGKSRLALQLAAALASSEAAWPVPWQTTTSDRHPVTLPPTEAGGIPVVVASWEDEADEVHRRLAAQPVHVAELGDRLHFVDAAEWGPLWAPQEGSRHVQTVAELTPAGLQLRRLCERVRAQLLIVDPLAAAYGSDENVRGLVRQFMASWDAWGRRTDCAVLMIAHPPKSQGNSSTASESDDWWSGSTDWLAAARGAWALRREPARKAKKGGTEARPERTWLECAKASYGMAPERVYLAADGVTWRAAWKPTAEAVGTANGGGKVGSGVDTSEV